ncbi:hypothetical protein APUTEX25_001906, partial [Auxenochlorella protothecoides]
DTATITLNFIECIHPSSEGKPTSFITCTASVTASDMPLNSYWIDYVWGTVFDTADCHKVYSERISCTVGMTLQQLPTVVVLTFNMSDGSNYQQQYVSRSTKMTYTAIFIAFSPLGTVTATVMAGDPIIDAATITLNFIECIDSSSEGTPTNVITCTASVTASEMPLNAYWIDYTWGDLQGEVKIGAKQLTSFITWSGPGTSIEGSAYAWYQTLNGTYIRSTRIPIAPFKKIAVFDYAFCRRIYSERIYCTIYMTFQQLPTSVVLTFKMADGTTVQEQPLTNSKTMTYTAMFVGFSPFGTVEAILQLGTVITVGPYPISDDSLPPPPPSPFPPPSPPPPIAIVLSDAMCKQQEDELYRCQVQ